MKFIIYVPRYNENSGGAIVLHKLCDLLSKQGHDARLWPINKPRFSWRDFFRFSVKAALYYGVRMYRWRFTAPMSQSTAMARVSDIGDSIVVYPEIVEGNPLRAQRYVRWFLYAPGLHSERDLNFTGDLYFYFLESFDPKPSGAICGGKLAILDYFLGIYKFRNFGERSRVCYVIRKGKSRVDLPSFSGLWILDGLSHNEMAQAFNECSRCYFYDPYTLYSTYAALCGCVPIIVPVPGLTKEQWLPEESLRYGLAYGEEDIPFAIATRNLLIERLSKDEDLNDYAVRRFVAVVRDFFNLKC